MPARKQPNPAGHEGATESTTPGAPATREVITPDWVPINDGKDPSCPPPARTKGTRQPAKPAIDRHR